ncbi:hypothetical protein DFJ74DRAFT_775336 [Hyaloraphidium curvatum]|nr:hypothetical protein DFJ74DRAFT_775336 [Hyaloraphidium curvatum]
MLMATEVTGSRRVLESFADVDGLRAEMFGFAVGWGFLRSLVVGMATLFLGMWTLLRSAGLVLTLESFCPG